MLAFWPRVARNSPERAHGAPQKASLARVQNALTSCKNAVFRSLSDVNKLCKNVRFVYAKRPFCKNEATKPQNTKPPKFISRAELPQILATRTAAAPVKQKINHDASDIDRRSWKSSFRVGETLVFVVRRGSALQRWTRKRNSELPFRIVKRGTSCTLAFPKCHEAR